MVQSSVPDFAILANFDRDQIPYCFGGENRGPSARAFAVALEAEED